MTNPRVTIVIHCRNSMSMKTPDWGCFKEGIALGNLKDTKWKVAEEFSGKDDVEQLPLGCLVRKRFSSCLAEAMLQLMKREEGQS